jgi:hypothetical protein
VHAELAKEWRTQRLEHDSNAIPANSDERVQVGGLTWLKKQATNVDLNDPSAGRTFENGCRRVLHREAKGRLNSHWASIWLNAIKTAQRIRKIAAQAIQHNVRVRWFDFHEFVRAGKPSGGVKNLLIPLNAVELLAPAPSKDKARYLARLSPVNEQSLVFMSPFHCGCWPYDLDVVFTGDSPLGDGLNYAKSFLPKGERCGYAIATAPHHGSENNSMAYTHLTKMSRVLIWLRSGGSANQPGPTFKSIPPHKRACMHCPQFGYVRSTAVVQLPSSGSAPFLQLRSHYCCCR